jgi:hypothetical protein
MLSNSFDSANILRVIYMLLYWTLCIFLGIFEVIMFRKLDSLTSSRVNGGKDPTQVMSLQGGSHYQLFGLYFGGPFTYAELLTIHLYILYYSAFLLC